MIIELQRAFSPEEMYEDDCGIRGERFRVGTVIAFALTEEERLDVGRACEACVEYLGARNPEKFPTIHEYERAVRRYPEPIWPSGEEAGRAEDEDTFDAAYKASFIFRGPHGE